MDGRGQTARRTTVTGCLVSASLDLVWSTIRAEALFHLRLAFFCTFRLAPVCGPIRFDSAGVGGSTTRGKATVCDSHSLFVGQSQHRHYRSHDEDDDVGANSSDSSSPTTPSSYPALSS
ncbi:hypothetical protein LZ31DRAFT_555771 [Colletotrichum somersetense]|nr:hypothetical protein LZ31DRAFT_555771 [Colletotrichum somersetense]